MGSVGVALSGVMLSTEPVADTTALQNPDIVQDTLCATRLCSPLIDSSQACGGRSGLPTLERWCPLRKWGIMVGQKLLTCHYYGQVAVFLRPANPKAKWKQKMVIQQGCGPYWFAIRWLERARKAYGNG